ncbi:MAG: putative RDD family membrane protein YckC [Flavobacteriales bacterium]|jgi:uncharacterized RDD family membrane protein YckC
MRTIEIRTTQNATISYELAPLSLRIFAFILDFVLLGTVGAILYAFSYMLPGAYSAQLMQFIIITPMIAFYTLVSEVILDGQTIGKKALQIRVVKLNGKRVEPFDFVLRWAFRMVDIWMSLGSLSAILISATDNGQRLGGIISNTAVIRLKPNMEVSLEDLLKINRLEDYEPTYLGVKSFKEADMLLIKHTIDRYKKFKNDAHKEALHELARVVGQRLGLDSIPEDEVAFLRAAVKDYIVLTR